MSYPLVRNFWSRGWGYKTGSSNYLEHPVPLFGGEFSKQDSYVSKGGPFGVMGLIGLQINYPSLKCVNLFPKNGSDNFTQFITKPKIELA